MQDASENVALYQARIGEHEGRVGKHTDKDGQPGSYEGTGEQGANPQETEVPLEMYGQSIEKVAYRKANQEFEEKGYDDANAVEGVDPGHETHHTQEKAPCFHCKTSSCAVCKR